MGIPFMDISNTVNSMVNDAVGIPPAAPEPSGPIDITDKVGPVKVGIWGNGGNMAIENIPLEYIGYYVEFITQWPDNSKLYAVQGSNVNNRTDTIEGTTIITKGIISEEIKTNPHHGIGVMVASGQGIVSNPTLISIKVSETEF